MEKGDVDPVRAPARHPGHPERSAGVEALGHLAAAFPGEREILENKEVFAISRAIVSDEVKLHAVVCCRGRRRGAEQERCRGQGDCQCSPHGRSLLCSLPPWGEIGGGWSAA